MAGPGKPPSLQPRRPDPRNPGGGGVTPPRRPPQVVMLKKDDPKDAPPVPAEGGDSVPPLEPRLSPVAPKSAATTSPPSRAPQGATDEDRFSLAELEGMTMADLLGPSPSPAKAGGQQGGPQPVARGERRPERSVDDFDFDEEAFLAALDDNEPIGTTGELVKGTVIAVESDGVYVDVGGKAPGFMPKRECGLGVITSLKERFPKGLPVEVLVTREQNAEGMVTVSVRALELRKSWEKVLQLEKEGTVVQVKVNGFNRGGVTCDLEGLRGFIPRSQLLEGEQHEALVGKTLGVAFLEVNPETRKLVISEKKASTALRFRELEVGQLVEGQISAIKPYGYCVDLGGVSGLLHHSSITGAALRDLREAFQLGERIKALITAVDGQRGRIALNTVLLENQPGELLIAKDLVMGEAAERSNRALSLLKQREQQQQQDMQQDQEPSATPEQTSPSGTSVADASPGQP
ncbi:MAG: S1 RNA-binding domain-containing protein [Cyanobium sp.]